MSVPFEPTAFPSGPHFRVMYELRLTNFAATPVSITRIDALDANATFEKPIATFEPEQLRAMLLPLGGKTLSSSKERLVIADGRSAIAYVFKGGVLYDDRAADNWDHHRTRMPRIRRDCAVC
jgi:hypothetical protein